ncbi:hypothetical protein ES702_06908 [subsurface metagenome]
MKASNSLSAKESKRKGLLGALDFDKCSTSKNAEEVEYQLYSWGEIFCSSFQGPREHSTEARHILRCFPFKLFSSSLPEGPLPQKLCLTFRAPLETRQEGHLVGNFPHEIAKEFTAFLSLITRRRIFVTKKTRSDGLPMEEEVELYQHLHSQEKQGSKGVDPEQIRQLLDNLRALDEPIANSFVLAMRLYHSATEMMYTEPEFSYLFLISSLEAISSTVFRDWEPKKRNFLNKGFPGWIELGKALSSQEQKEKLQKLLLTNERFMRQKIVLFVGKYAPERFFNENVDDAKPDYFNVMIGRGPNGLGRKYLSHSPISLKDREKIKKRDLESVLRKVYKARSQLIHNGIRLPESIVIGHFPRVKAEVMAELTERITKYKGEISLEIPPLLTFERLVSYSLVEFLRKYENAGV